MNRSLSRRLDRPDETDVLDARSASAVVRTGPRDSGEETAVSNS